MIASEEATTGKPEQESTEKAVQNVPQSSDSNNTQYSSRDSSRGGSGFDQSQRTQTGAMEVYVENNIEKAMKILKRKLIKEGVFKELKLRRYYEKPSERKKRKTKESQKKTRKEEARIKKTFGMMS